MSYGFTITADSKSHAKEVVRAKLSEILAAQPVHAVDFDQVVDNAYAVIDLLSGDSKEGHVVSVTLNGYVSGIWGQDGAVNELNSASISCHAGWAPKVG